MHRRSKRPRNFDDQVNIQHNIRMTADDPLPSDRKALLAAAAVFAVIPVIFPKSLWMPILVGLVAVGFVFLLYGGGDLFSGRDLSGEQRRSFRDRIWSANVPPVPKREFAPIDPSLYTLRTVPPEEIDLKDVDSLRNHFRHLALRNDGKLLDKVRKASLVGARNGNRGSGTKALVSLEDFFNRYHRALASKDPELAKRTLEVLRDTRTVALNAVEDLSFTVPLALSKSIREASESVRAETLECMSTLVLKHSPSLSPSLRASLTHWSSPLPNDPSGRVGDRHSLY